MIIDAADDLRVVGQAADGRTALTMLRTPERQADVVLMDIRMPGPDGVETTRRLMAAVNPPRVVMLTSFDDDELLVAALRAGACGYLLKDAGPAELVAGIRSAVAGDAPVSPRLTRRLIDSFVRPVPVAAERNPALDRLTAREREILAAVGLGLTNVEIAARLHVAESTVKTHVGAILRKLNLRDRVQAVILAQSAD
ncbi:response regulator transcription factor [Actinoplanes bogorensis]|uniref:Response regulator transcription factor n=2 Tax=Paractinoplanes bogorensis TaxID=1610840 RepID=A0ABS5YWV8_9ACTN|nr:response regulator transcription factor [Actinoplanes bogorensis]